MRILALALVALAVHAQIPDGRSTHRLRHGNRDRSFIVSRPPSIGAQPTGVVFVFHGFGSTGASMCNTAQVDQISRQLGFLGVCPQGVDNSWNAASCCGTAQFQNIDDVGFARAMVTYIRDQGFNIDARRVFTTGFSNGGMISYRIACQASDIFQGAGCAGGQYYGNQAVLGYPCNPPTVRPTAHLHGTLDAVIHFAAATAAYNRWATDTLRCADSTRRIFSDPAYFNMFCDERSPCRSPGAVHCTYQGMGHIWPQQALIRFWNYLTRGSMQLDEEQLAFVNSTLPAFPEEDPEQMMLAEIEAFKQFNQIVPQ